MDRDPRREQRRQEMLLDRLDARFAKSFTDEIARASRDMLDVYAQTGEVGAGRDHYDKLEAEFQRMATQAALTFGGRIVEQAMQKKLTYTIGDGGVGFISGHSTLYLERKEDFAQRMMRLALQYVAGEAIRRRITSISETTRARIVSAVDQGYREGLGVAEIARSIRDRIPAMSRIRGALIAQTETHGAANFGADVAARETGLTLRKEWVATLDARTRDTHARMDGETVGMDDAFSNRLMYPGDPSGSADEVINCRCGVSHIVVD